MRHMTPKGVHWLSKLEGGPMLNVYADSGGQPTIGVGHLLTKSERASGKIVIGGVSVKYEDGLTLAQAQALFHQDLEPAELAVEHGVWLAIKDHEFNALVSFTFNCGVDAFKGSTLRRRVNDGNRAAVPTQFRRWIYDNGTIVQGLINRREAEIEMWEGLV